MLCLRLWAALLLAVLRAYSVSAQNHTANSAEDSTVIASLYCGPFISPSKTVASLSQLPDNVRYKLDSYMKDRLGESAYSQVRFLEGRVVDVDSVLKQPNDYKWNVCSYYLCFTFQGAIAQIGLDRWGQPINGLTLPEVRRYPERANWISRSAALQIAKHKRVVRKNTLPEDIYSELSYAPELDIMRWIITVRQRQTDFASDMRKIILNAHTGEVIRIRKYESRSNF